MNKYIIPIIKKYKESKARKELRLPLYSDPPPECDDSKKVEEKPKRGSVIVDFSIDKDSSDEE